MKPSLCIACATYQSFDTVWATFTSLKANHPVRNVELLCGDNFGTREVEDFCKKAGVRYFVDAKRTGTAYPRGRLFEEAASSWVCCIDDHVILPTGVVQKMLDHVESAGDSNDLFQGPIVHPAGWVSTHQAPIWQDRMLGVWQTDERGTDPASPPFEIGMHGLGLFLCRKAAFPGFNRNFRGFGGEEYYLHQKFKRRGDRVWCLPWMRWHHRDRPPGVKPPYPNMTEDRVWNYYAAFDELSQDNASVRKHFLEQSMSDVALDRLEAGAKEANRRGF